MNRRVREMEIDEIDLMINYFLTADRDHLLAMGVEPSRLPPAAAWQRQVVDDLQRPLAQRHYYYLTWELDGLPVGHSNINDIFYGLHATMHLHLWQPQTRRSGHGTFFVRRSIARYFEKFQLQNLFCEPYALNPAPNRTLAKAGFELQKRYETVPGWICFPQEVNRWLLTRAKWEQS